MHSLTMSNIKYLLLCITMIAVVGYFAQYKLKEKNKKMIAYVEKYDEIQTVKQKDLFQLLKNLSSGIAEKATEKDIYGNIFTGEAKQQIESYLTVIADFQVNYPIKNICEIGFAGGHSATVFLLATATTNATYTGFDVWNKPVYENTALDWVKKHFPGRSIQIIKGSSVKEVPHFPKTGFCDLIHVDGAHHAHYPKADLLNMAHLASETNLLLIDDCTDSWPAVIKAVDYVYHKDLLKLKPTKHIAEGWTHRGSQKGWCISSYKTPPKSR